jgi:photosystem II stability/assembly factor-like uncharacterized protein
MKKVLLFSFVLFTTVIFSQKETTSASSIQEAVIEKESLEKNSLVKNVGFTNIGPTVMSGRVVDVDVNPNNTAEFYVGYASGGLWHTNNNGTTFTPVLDNSPTQNIGDIAVDWKTGIIWVGTGEKNSSRSSYAGIGMLKSTDKGKTWINVGLLDSHHVSRILINPNNSDEVVVGVIGHLYSKNAERGLFKTKDGGKTWNKTLFINDNTGIIDVEAAPENFNIMYAASWERMREAWNFDGDGISSAIYKSIDAGDSWQKISKNNGFPEGDGVGRIGLAVFNENTVYALHDSQFRRKDEKKKKSNSDRLEKDDFKTMSKSDFLALDNKKLNSYLKSNGFQEKYRAENVKQMVRVGSVKPEDLAKYLENANSLLFDTPVIGAEVFKTTNGGKSWKKTHDDFLNGVYNSYGYYFGEIRVDPQDVNGIYILGVPIIKSKDGGKTFTNISRENVHSDHQALWVNPKKQGHLLDGNDGGLNMSYDDGESWIKLNNPSVGQFYSVYADTQKNYKVYGGLQDNGVWVANHNARIDKRWHQSGQNPYESIMGGDGMQVQVDERDQNIIYTGYQFGNYFRVDRNGRNKYIQPKHTLGENPYRFNWQTPILLSKHNQDILYLGGNKLHRSLNKGDDWETISGDLTTGGKKGNVAYGTLTSISESPFQFGLLYVGSDDGLVHVSKNGGGNWTNISGNLPNDLWVSRVIASSHKKERVYVTLNGYRFDDFTSYVYMSDNYGQTWKNIGNSVPTSPVNVIKEDPVNENLLYLGTDNGLYVSFNQGISWQVFSNNFPNVAVHDLVVQDVAKHLIVGTHGRSLYKANIAPLQKMNTEVLAKQNHIFDIASIRKNSSWGRSWSQWRDAYIPEVTIPFYTKSNGNLTIAIYSGETKVNSIAVDANKGYNEANFDVSFSKAGMKAFEKANKKASLRKASNGVYYLPKGKYIVKIGAETSEFEVK